MLFPVCNKQFPVLIAGNSSREAGFLKGSVQAGRNVSREIPCIFPAIREFRHGDTFAAASQHSQPVAGFPTLSRDAANAPQEARNCVPNWPVDLSHVTWERALQRKTPLSCRFIATGQFRGSHFLGGRWSPPTAEHHVRDASPAGQKGAAGFFTQALHRAGSGA